jgi:hypothetical protein
MSSPARITGPDITVLLDASASISRDPAKLMPERRAVSRFVEADTTARPTESEIATVAYQLWVDEGCPDGTDQADWFRAKAMLESALVASREGVWSRLSGSFGDISIEYEILAEYQGEGHWEVWEREWGGAHWVRD